MKIRLKPALFLFACLQLTTFSGVADDLECPALSNGTWTGNFVRIIDKTGYEATNYVFKSSSGYNEGCVQSDANNTVRDKIIYNAFILGETVTIRVKDKHYIDGITFAYN